MNALTFGNISKMYMLLPQDIQIKVSRNYPSINESQMISILAVMVKFRNIIEHLDERNVKTMMESRGVGCFNVIFEDSVPNMVVAINANREFYPYNLDLVNKKILFYNIQARPDDIKEFKIDILKMQDELKKLEQYVN
jgi:hypothetical protein